MAKLNLMLGASVLLLTSVTHAGTIDTFNDKAAFLGSTSATSITGAIPNSGGVGNSTTLGDVTFSTTDFATSTDVFFGQWSTLISGFEIAISGSENLNISINLGTDVSSFGFDFHEPTTTNQVVDGTNTPFSHESIFTIDLFNSSTFMDSVIFDPLGDQLEFFGLTSNMGFDSIRITENLNGLTYAGGIDISNDNEFFGEFYTAATIVSEPSFIALLATGLLWLVMTHRRLRQEKRKNSPANTPENQARRRSRSDEFVK